MKDLENFVAYVENTVLSAGCLRLPGEETVVSATELRNRVRSEFSDSSSSSMAGRYRPGGR